LLPGDHLYELFAAEIVGRWHNIILARTPANKGLSARVSQNLPPLSLKVSTRTSNDP